MAIGQETPCDNPFAIITCPDAECRINSLFRLFMHQSGAIIGGDNVLGVSRLDIVLS